jgi:hypothetical protein
VKLDFGQGIHGTVSVNATRLVVRDSFNQPLMLVVEHDPQTIMVYKAKPGDDSLKEMLNRIGVEHNHEVREIRI